MSLKSIVVESFQIVKDELANSKKLQGKNLELFKQIYGISELDSDIYANKYNIILTCKEDYDKLKYLVKEDRRVLNFNVMEYGLGIFIFRHINDQMLGETVK